MNRRALRREERLDLLGHCETAITEVRQVLEISTEIGPVLVSAFAAMSAVRALRETIDGLPILEEKA